MEEAIGGGSSAGDDNGRASKKKAFISSSIDKVLSNEDLLIEILLLLPVISLHLFKRVSKLWLSVIKSPSFISRRTQISGFVPPSGLFIVQRSPSAPYDFLSFDSRKKFKRATFTYNPLMPTKLSIMQSCNGLLLCCNYKTKKHYFVYNPLTSMFKKLPPVQPLNYTSLSRFNYFKLAFDPTKSPHYKVVHVGLVLQDAAAGVDGRFIKIQTYSSESGVWTVRDDQFSSTSFEYFWDGIYCDGAIHWLNLPNDPFHLKLEFVDCLVLTKIQTPLTLKGEVHYDRKLFMSCGSLLLLCKDDYSSRELIIYEMKNGYSEWSIKYIINLEEMLRRTWYLPKDWCCYYVLSIFFGEREEDSFMVIELSRKVVQYKFASKAVTTLLDLGEGVGILDCHDFIASFAHISGLLR